MIHDKKCRQSIDYHHRKWLPNWPGLWNILIASLQRGKTPTPMSVLDMMQNNLMVRFQ